MVTYLCLVFSKVRISVIKKKKKMVLVNDRVIIEILINK